MREICLTKFVIKNINNISDKPKFKMFQILNITVVKTLLKYSLIHKIQLHG